MFGCTPLYYAFREGNSDMVIYLLSKRASPWSKGKN